ncbi:MAG: hypothetical protein ACQETI_14885 [Halobacteriota archaeon]
MEVRDAVEEDAEGLAAIADAPSEVMRNLIHDRTVRVAERESTATDPNANIVDEDQSGLLGFVSYDATTGTVHVTQIGGTVDACVRLLEEPIRFARGERMAVEVLIPADEDDVREAVDRVGFEKQGSGPMFRGTRTVRYRMRPRGE